MNCRPSRVLTRPMPEFMNTYWYANPIGGHTPATNAIAFTFTNLPNDTYDVYVYVLQQVSSGHNGNGAKSMIAALPTSPRIATVSPPPAAILWTHLTPPGQVRTPTRIT